VGSGSGSGAGLSAGSAAASFFGFFSFLGKFPDLNIVRERDRWQVSGDAGESVLNVG
jgi:hypothetical protein